MVIKIVVHLKQKLVLLHIDRFASWLVNHRVQVRQRRPHVLVEPLATQYRAHFGDSAATAPAVSISLFHFLVGIPSPSSFPSSSTTSTTSLVTHMTMVARGCQPRHPRLPNPVRIVVINTDLMTAMVHRRPALAQQIIPLERRVIRHGREPRTPLCPRHCTITTIVFSISPS